MHKSYWTSFRKVFFILPVFFMYGCGVWSNFTTFFNLYYNTRDDFREAERLIFEQKRDLFSTDELVVPGSAVTLLNKVEVKASKILQFHANTAFVDDALLMLGKSYYYQKNYQKALRKFQELISTQENDDLYLEDSLWIGKTQMRLKEYDDALKTLISVRGHAISEGEEELFEEAYIEEIKYNIFRVDFPKAIALINEFLALPATDLVKAKVSYELGKLNVKTNDIPGAIAAFQNVSEYSSDFDVILDAQLGLAEAYRLNNEPEISLEILEDLRSEEKYKENYHRIDLESAFAYLQRNDIPEALHAFTTVDTAFPSSISAGTAKFEKAKIYESKDVNFDSAYFYYMKASTSTAPPKVIIDATEKAQMFKKYQYIRSLINDNKKQLEYALDSTAFIKDSIAFVSDTVKTEEELAANEQENLDPGDERGGGRNQRFGGQTNLNLQQEEKRPPVRPVLQPDSLKRIIVKSEFDLANLFFTDMNRPDSAFFYYNDIVTNYPVSIYSGRTLYSLAGYYQSINDSVKADSIYNIIYENFKNETVVNAAALKIKKPVIDLEYDPAKQMYIDAEKLLKENRFQESVNKFYDIYVQYPKSPQAPRSLRSSGWILENKLTLNDSAAAVYDTLVSKYPQSPFANEIRPKLTVYKDERLKKQKDLKKKETPPVSDSVKTVTNGNLQFPQNPVTAQDSLKLQHAITVDSLRRQNPPGNLNRLFLDTLNPKREGTLPPEKK